MNNDNQSFIPNQNTTPEPANPTPAPVSEPTPAPVSEPTPAPVSEPTPAPTLTPEPQSAPEPSPVTSSVQSQPTPLQPTPIIPDSDPMPDIPIRSPKPPVNTRMIALIVIAVALVVCAVVAIIMISNANNKKPNNNNSSNSSSVEKNFTASYDLSEQTSDLKIDKGGIYELTGELKEHSVLVDANDEVTLYLNDADISAAETAAIANISTNQLTIELADKSTNTISDGGASEYDGCIFSNGALIINGSSGILNVSGQQEKGEGITTKSNDITINGGTINISSADDGLNAGGDGGTITINGGDLLIQAGGDGIDSNKDLVINGGSIYIIGSSAGGNAAIDSENGYAVNGGSLIALGTDMLEKPSDSSKQNSIVVALDKAYDAKSKIILENSDKEIIFEIVAGNSFRTVILSSGSINYGTYSLKINDDIITDSLNVINTVTTYGNTDQKPEDNPTPESPDTPAPENNQPNNNQANNAELPSNGTDIYGRIPIADLPSEETN